LAADDDDEEEEEEEDGRNEDRQLQLSNLMIMTSGPVV